jgi:hypothetical protein
MTDSEKHFVLRGFLHITGGQSKDFFVDINGEDVPLRAASMPMKNVNLLVGTNNSGKSRFLRLILRENAVIIASKRGADILNGVSLFHEKSSAIADTSNEASELRHAASEGLKNHNGANLFYHLQGVEFPQASLEALLFRQEYASSKTIESALKLLAISPMQEGEATRISAPSRGYVPPMRYAGRMTSSTQMLADMTTNNWEMRESEHRRIFHGASLYEDLLGMATGSRETRDTLRAFETLLSREFFAGDEVSLVPRAGKIDDALRTIELERKGISQRPLHELGDGVGMIVLLLSCYFLLPENSWLGIEEPETGLHPAFQRKFLDVVINAPEIKARNITTWMTTHSNTLLGMSGEYSNRVSVLHFRQVPGVEKVVCRAVDSDLFEAMRDLGVHNSSVLLANYVIWVEGPTEVTYLRAGINAHPTTKEKGLREDIDYAFFMYGGALLSHYSESESDSEDALDIKKLALSNRIFVLADNDEPPAESAKAKLHARLCSEATARNEQITFQTTKGIEFENEIPRLAWERMLQVTYGDRKNPASDGSPTITERLGTWVKDELKNGWDEEVSCEASPDTRRLNGNTLTTSYKNRFARSFAELLRSEGGLSWDDIQESPFGTLVDQIVTAIIAAKSQ